MARPKGRNLSEAERIVYGDRALALKLQGLTHEEITREVPVHKNTVTDLTRAAARRRSQDRDLVEEINRGIAIQRQLIEDLLRDFRSIGSGTTRRANTRARLASQIIRAQMSLLFLSGVEVPDPERIIMDALEEMRAQMPDLADLLSQPEVPIGAPEHPDMAAEYPVIAEAGATTDDEDDDPGFFFESDGPDY